MGVHKIVLRYDGRAYFGWQRHGDKPTVQGAVETALGAVVGTPCTVHGAGRTDRGAHAEGQVLSVELPPIEDVVSLERRVNEALPLDIRVLSVTAVADDFHARTNALGKVYRYEIWNHAACPRELRGRVWHLRGAIDAAKVTAACSALVGSHDFSSFATRPNFQQKSTRRRIDSVTVTPEHPRITITFVADGFLYKMVRNMVRALLKVGEGRWSKDDLAGALAARDRQSSPGTAPASGLYLDEVFYEDGRDRPVPAQSN